MKIVSKYDGNEYGSIITSLPDLDKDIKELRRYGVALSSIVFRDLRVAIEQNYLAIEVSSVTLGNDGRLDDLLDEVKEYVSGDKDYVTEDFCYIRSVDFDGLARDCGYGKYELKALRTTFEKRKYIYTREGRSTVLKRIKDKPERVLAFYREKLGVDVPVKENKKQAETSDKT